jgi:hypothetical protein
MVFEGDRITAAESAPGYLQGERAVRVRTIFI